MKELKGLKKIYLDNYDIEVKQYLSLSQIQKIINEVIQVDTFEERENVIDYLLLIYCTNIGQEKIDELGPDILIESGLVDEVKKNIKNIDKLIEGIGYSESAGKALRDISKKLPNDLSELINSDISK